MSAKPQQSLFIKLATIVLIFLYLQVSLWSTLVHPAIDIYINWIPKSFFFSAKQTTTILRIHHHTCMALFESTFFSALALFGYFYGCGGSGGSFGSGIYGTSLATFEQSMMGVKYKYYWMCIVPWIITFIQNWLQNVGALLMLFSYNAVYEASNVWLSIIILLLLMFVQLLLASEVVLMALHGWHTMKNINDENMLWEQNKRFLDGDSLNTVFGEKT